MKWIMVGENKANDEDYYIRKNLDECLEEAGKPEEIIIDLAKVCTDVVKEWAAENQIKTTVVKTACNDSSLAVFKELLEYSGPYTIVVLVWEGNNKQISQIIEEAKNNLIPVENIRLNRELPPFNLNSASTFIHDYLTLFDFKNTEENIKTEDNIPLRNKFNQSENRGVSILNCFYYEDRLLYVKWAILRISDDEMMNELCSEIVEDDVFSHEVKLSFNNVCEWAEKNVKRMDILINRNNIGGLIEHHLRDALTNKFTNKGRLSAAGSRVRNSNDIHVLVATERLKEQKGCK